MALTITLSGDWQGNSDNQRYVQGQLAFDSSYPTGGESLTAANIGLRVIEHINVQPRSGFVFDYDYTNSLLLAYRTGAATVTAGATPAAALAEVSNTTDLSTLTGVRFRAVGY